MLVGPATDAFWVSSDKWVAESKLHGRAQRRERHHLYDGCGDHFTGCITA